VADVLLLVEAANVRLHRRGGDFQVFGDLVIRQAGVDQTEYLPFPAGKGRCADQFGYIRPVDNILNDGFVQ
jgi:hypothetical protein